MLPLFMEPEVLKKVEPKSSFEYYLFCFYLFFTLEVAAFAPSGCSLLSNDCLQNRPNRPVDKTQKDGMGWSSDGQSLASSPFIPQIRLHTAR